MISMTYGLVDGQLLLLPTRGSGRPPAYLYVPRAEFIHQTGLDPRARPDRMCEEEGREDGGDPGSSHVYFSGFGRNSDGP